MDGPSIKSVIEKNFFVLDLNSMKIDEGVFIYV